VRCQKITVLTAQPPTTNYNSGAEAVENAFPKQLEKHRSKRHAGRKAELKKSCSEASK